MDSGFCPIRVVKASDVYQVKRLRLALTLRLREGYTRNVALLPLGEGGGWGKP